MNHITYLYINQMKYNYSAEGMSALEARVLLEEAALIVDKVACKRVFASDTTNRNILDNISDMLRRQENILMDFIRKETANK